MKQLEQAIDLFSGMLRAENITKEEAYGCNEILTALRSSIPFDISELHLPDEINEAPYSKIYSPLPFDNVFFVDDSKKSTGIVVVEEENSRLMVIINYSKFGCNSLFKAVRFYKDYKEGQEFEIIYPDVWNESFCSKLYNGNYANEMRISNENDDSHCASCVRVMKSIYMLNEGLATEKDVKTKHRITKGKRKNATKIYKSKKIIINLSAIKEYSKSENKTGQTKSAHLRRGHWRNYKTGRKSWVKACGVGNIKKGFVNKEYSIIDKD